MTMPQPLLTTAPPAWKVLNEGSSAEPLVLAVDFAVSGRPESTFADLGRLLAPSVPLWETRQPELERARTFDGEDFVSYWVRGVRDTGRPVRAVLGYCVGGLYAARVAQLLAAEQDEAPTVVLFDPEPPHQAGMVADFRAAVARLCSVLSPEESALAGQAAVEAAQQSAGLAALGAALTEVFTGITGAAFARAELPAELAGELSGAYEAFVAYIAAAAVFDPAVSWEDATALTTPAADPHARYAGRLIPVDAAHEDILRSPATADVLTGLLTRSRPQS
ncbi:hypothetical protein QQY66_44030 [Streptomyces sp. DG2A-72]|uniref:hypothetical protein n=1 Tax=Streptomyces sp. DG2A-72 TaxID=3051386 RepID=UPI00265C5C97|nr:hypothetical protein [Streptomyces sp. DG2A-72]MDO0938358.1 hypothetical protein [Streptomyces sp. DG2A-72]